jgi:hypothetical protein
LDRFLTKYLKNVTTEHATVWGGQLVFKNVELYVLYNAVNTTHTHTYTHTRYACVAAVTRNRQRHRHTQTHTYASVRTI